MADSYLEPDDDLLKEDEEERSRQASVAAAWAAISLLSGALLVMVAMAGAKSEAVYLMDKVVRFDTAGPYGEDLDGASQVLTSLMLVRFLVFVGLAIIITSLIGMTASTGKHRCLAATYGSTSVACAAVTLMVSMQVVQRIWVVEPLVDRQVDHLCNSSIYLQLGSALHCRWAEHVGVQEECGTACGWKISLLQGAQGCHLMPQLCESFFYQELPSANCTDLMRRAKEGAAPLFVSSESSDACRNSCDADIKCKEYSHSAATPARPEVCLLFSGLVAFHKPPAWSTIQPSQVESYLEDSGETKCWRRTKPTVLSRFQTHDTRIAASAVICAVVLLISVSAAFTLMYNLNHRRSRLSKPNGSQLWMMMFCPCCVPHLHQRFNRLALSDDSSEESGSE
mmetsp:Transcript_56400/g.125897  ORF Transcript_56400/g.125897 Transcript_56400/m.125897 type:complete len:396 (+) Transcript_56400:59-1246(+)